MLCDGACWAAQEVVAWCVGLTKGSRVSLAVVFGSLGNWGLSGPPGAGCDSVFVLLVSGLRALVGYGSMIRRMGLG